MSDYNVVGASHFNAFIDSGYDARKRIVPRGRLPEVNMTCAVPNTQTGVLLDDFLSRIFFFFPTFPGDYRIKLTNIFGVPPPPHPPAFQPYIAILDSGYVPPPGYVVSDELTITIPIPPAPGGITGLVGSNNGKPGGFDLRIFFPDRPDSVLVSGTTEVHYVPNEDGYLILTPCEPRSCIGVINEAMGTMFSGVLQYVPCTTYWEETDGAAFLRLAWANNIWCFYTSPFPGGTIGNEFLGYCSLGGGSPFPGPVDPYGRYNTTSGPGGFEVEIV